MPIELARNDVVERAHGSIRRRVDTARRSAGFRRLDRFQEQLAHDDDRTIGRSEMLFRPIYDRAHAFLQGDILGVEPWNAGKRFVFLNFAIDQVVVRKCPLEAVLIVGVEVVRAAARFFLITYC